MENVIIQTRGELEWLSYSRCTADEARAFLARNDRTKYRAVDWITWEPIEL